MIRFPRFKTEMHHDKLPQFRKFVMSQIKVDAQAAVLLDWTKKKKKNLPKLISELFFSAST